MCAQEPKQNKQERTTLRDIILRGAGTQIEEARKENNKTKQTKQKRKKIRHPLAPLDS
jgi:hypothetical protein